MKLDIALKKSHRGLKLCHETEDCPKKDLPKIFQRLYDSINSLDIIHIIENIALSSFQNNELYKLKD